MVFLDLATVTAAIYRHREATSDGQRATQTVKKTYTKTTHYKRRKAGCHSKTAWTDEQNGTSLLLMQAVSKAERPFEQSGRTTILILRCIAHHIFRTMSCNHSVYQSKLSHSESLGPSWFGLFLFWLNRNSVATSVLKLRRLAKARP